MIIVMKFGGSILSDAEAYKRMASIVEKHEDKRKAVVVSAMKNVTDELYKIVGSEKEKRGKLINNLWKEHLKLLKSMGNTIVKENALGKLEKEFKFLCETLETIKPGKEIDKRDLDQIVIFGERFSAIVTEAFMLMNGISCQAFMAEEIGVVANENYGNAFADMKKSKTNVKKKLGRKINYLVPIITGFYGKTSNLDFATFGRGGSDYSAAILAYCLGAKELTLWKDVNGFMTADPKLVKKPRQLTHLSYEEASELGYFGAKVLHPKTIVPLSQINCKLIMRNFNDISNPGTIIGEKICSSECYMKSISYQKNIATVSIHSPEFVGIYGILAKVFDALAERKVSVDLVSTSETGVLLTIDQQDINAAKAAIKSLGIQDKHVKIDKSVALIGFIGENIEGTPGVTGKIFETLGRAKINIEAISYGPTGINISFVVKEKQLKKAIDVLHEKFLHRKKVVK